MKYLRRLKQSLAALAGPPPTPNWYRQHYKRVRAEQEAQRLADLARLAESLGLPSYSTSSNPQGWSQRKLRRQTRRF